MRSGIDREGERMLLNDTIECGGYVFPLKDCVEFSLSGTTIAAAAQLEAPYVLTEGEDTVASFAGYAQTAVYLGSEEGSVRLRAARELPTESKDAIEAVEANLGALSAQVSAADAKAEEAKAAADSAAESANPQVVTFARMAVPSMAEGMTVAEGASVSTLWPERVVGDTVKLKDFFWYGGELYRCNQPELTITTGQEPDKNLPALYGHVSVAPDGLLVWDADDLAGAPDIYNTGVKVHYPDADGPVYVSGRDGNTSTPGTDEWWTLAEG